MRQTLTAFAVVALLAAPVVPTYAAVPKAAVTATAPAPKPQAWDGRFYLMRGLLGGALNYSRGMDTLAAKATNMRVKGYVKPHWRRSELVATAIANYRIDKLPVFFGGHSVGADEVSKAVAQLRAAGVPVAAAFYYDPTSLVQCTRGNVERAVEFRNTALFQLGQGYMTLCADFRGTSTIYSKSISHTYLDDDPVVQSSTLCEIKNAIAKSPINICPAVGWASSLPVIADILSIVPAMAPTAGPTPRSQIAPRSDRLTRVEPGG